MPSPKNKHDITNINSINTILCCFTKKKTSWSHNGSALWKESKKKLPQTQGNSLANFANSFFYIKSNQPIEILQQQKSIAGAQLKI